MLSNDILAGMDRQAQLDAAKAAFLANGKTVEVLPPFQYDPYAPRSNRIDPESRLKRKPTTRATRAAEKAAFIQMAESL